MNKKAKQTGIYILIAQQKKKDGIKKAVIFYFGPEWDNKIVNLVKKLRLKKYNRAVDYRLYEKGEKMLNPLNWFY